MTSTNAALVIVASRHTVNSASETSWRALGSSFRLGPLDFLVPPSIPVAVIFVYRRPPPTASDVELLSLERLRQALALLLDYYPHLTGRLEIDPTDGSFGITRFGSGVELLEARCSEQLQLSSSSSEPGSARRSALQYLPAGGNALLAPFDATLEGVCRSPVLTVQHTRFACGGVALGVRLLHAICDADGFFQLVRDLAELYRGLQGSKREGESLDRMSSSSSLSHPPHVRPYLSQLRASEVHREALDFQPSLYYAESAAQSASSVTEKNTVSFKPSVPAVTGRVLRFSSRELEAAKTRATNPNSTSSDDGWVSTFETLSACLYQRVHQARLRLRAKDSTIEGLSPPNFLTPLNVRGRLGHACFPVKYFPNALLHAFTSVPSDVLATGPLWQIAKALHDMTRTDATTSSDDMIRTLRWVAMQPDKRKIRPGFLYGNGSLMISQWNKFDMYAGCAFEVPPVLVTTPFTPISLVDGLGYFLPSAEQSIDGLGGQAQPDGKGAETGGIDVHIALSEPLWDILDQDESILSCKAAALACRTCALSVLWSSGVSKSVWLIKQL